MLLIPWYTRMPVGYLVIIYFKLLSVAVQKGETSIFR